MKNKYITQREYIQQKYYNLRYARSAPSHKVRTVDILANVLAGKFGIQKMYNLREAVNSEYRKPLILLVELRGFEPLTF